MPNGGSFSILLHPEVRGDLDGVPRNVASRILRAMDARLAVRPEAYGRRLGRSLEGYWRLRVGDYRVVYEIVGTEVRGYGVMHRRDVYRRILRRLREGWDPFGPRR